jgi:hypothetical protein
MTLLKRRYKRKLEAAKSRFADICIKRMGELFKAAAPIFKAGGQRDHFRMQTEHAWKRIKSSNKSEWGPLSVFAWSL